MGELVITGEELPNECAEIKALSDFYHAFNTRNIQLMEKSWMNTEEISQFIPPQHLLTPVLKWREFEVGTLEDKHTASMGDFIIRGVAGEYYPCKPDIFAQTYEEVYSDGTA